MKLPALITTDLHLTDRPQDEYRWKLFPWLSVQCKKHKIKTLAILGDLTDAKDYHSSTLVNRIVSSITSLTEVVENVIILKGNHDYLKDGHAFFSFLSFIPRVSFVNEFLMSLDDEDGDSLFIGHTKTPNEDWIKWKFSKFDYVFMHQTVNGAKSENGTEMTSSLSSKFNSLPKEGIFSGDIHVPQVIGDVEYVGSPYPIRFGDDFVAHCILIGKDHSISDLNFKTIEKGTLITDSFKSVMRELDRYSKEDQLKITLNLSIEEKCNWQQIRRDVTDECHKLGIVLHELTAIIPTDKEYYVHKEKELFSSKAPPEKILERFVDKEGLGGDILDAGMDSIK